MARGAAHLLLLSSVLLPGALGFQAAPARVPRALGRQLRAVKDNREAEIRRKIAQLKREGRLRRDPAEDEEEEERTRDVAAPPPSDRNARYEALIRQRLGDRKSRLLGIPVADGAAGDEDDDDDDTSPGSPRLGALPRVAVAAVEAPAVEAFAAVEGAVAARRPIINPDLFEPDDGGRSERSDDDLAMLVAERLAEKKERERLEKEQAAATAAEEATVQAAAPAEAAVATLLTTGVGGAYAQNTTAQADLYRPKVSTWGAFPRPRDISKAYGGGRRIGPGYSNEQSAADADAVTRAMLQRYREKMGIDVPSEREHADEINDALAIGSRSMQRGLYSNAVSALEKVTKYCSTNSELGGTVYLELAMAYEAAGQTEEAITVYRALTDSRIERIKLNAKRLLYSIEAFTFMRDDVKAQEFNRRAAKNTFIDTTNFDNFAKNFDDVYNTAYIDREGSVYKRLTESIVRSPREARQVLLRATNAGEQSRMRIVQALRSISRHFDDALDLELRQNAKEAEPVAVINGKPILPTGARAETLSKSASFRPEDFVLADPETMLDNLEGVWRLQLLADKRGEGVKFFNKTESWQRVDVKERTFSSSGPQGFVRVEQSGNIEFNRKRRVLWRSGVEVTNGGVFAGLFGKTSGAFGAIRAPQQIMSVDSVLLITRCVPSRRARDSDDEKDHFAVWRKVEPKSLQSRLF